jgi:predicted GIY-YIG superfamily endonuclease
MDEDGMKKSGIYRLDWSNGYFYIGQSQDLSDRWRCHKKRFMNGTMDKCQKKLFRIWQKHGTPVFSIIIECDIELLNDIEQKYITENWNNKMFCNTSPSSRNNRGAKIGPCQLGIKKNFTPGGRKILVDVGKRYQGIRHPRNKFTIDEANSIIEKYSKLKETKQRNTKCTIYSLAEEYKVSKSLIYNLISNNHWANNINIS